jgi:NACHT domain
MFQWYHHSTKCYVYLSDVSIDGFDANDQVSQFKWESAFRRSRWFTRGWTLQELIAPASVEFFSMEGRRLGDKKSLERQIHEITGIPARALQGGPLSHFSVTERMLWAAKRKTTRIEDEAYSLLGIFDIHMPLIYGEGREKALMRLNRGIDKCSKDFRLAKLPTVPQAAFNSNQERQLPLCLINTQVKVLQEIRDWAHGGDDRPIFWLNGLAGVGKSTIARTIARENYDNGCLGASFFFSGGRGDLGHAGKFFPTIARQLAERMPPLEDHICMSLEKHDVPRMSLRDQWHHLILTPLSSLSSNISPSRLLIVIDALDECEGDNDVRVLLKLLSEVRDIITVQLRVLITSRPETPLRLGLHQIPQNLYHGLELEELSGEEATNFLENLLIRKDLLCNKRSSIGRSVDTEDQPCTRHSSSCPGIS